MTTTQRKPVLSYSPNFNDQSSIVDFNGWIKESATIESDQPYGFHSCYHIPTIEYLSSIKNLGGYTTAPVGCHKGRTYEVRCEKITDIIEFKNKLEAIDGLILLYQAIYHPAMPYFFELDEQTQTQFPTIGDVNFTQARWDIKYAVLSN